MVVEQAKVTIAHVLDEFLKEHQDGVAAKTIRKYKEVIDLLQAHLNGYAYEGLSKPERELFERLNNAKGDEHREFCEMFGPDNILPHVGMFLSYFMVRKVIAGKELLRVAGTVLKKLAKWLEQKGYAKAEEAEQAGERDATAARDLPAAAALQDMLAEYADETGREEQEDNIEDHFTIEKIESGKLWLESYGGQKCGPISLPEAILKRCKVGWEIAGVVGKMSGKWRIVSVWNVYP